MSKYKIAVDHNCYYKALDFVDFSGRKIRYICRASRVLMEIWGQRDK